VKNSEYVVYDILFFINIIPFVLMNNLRDEKILITLGKHIRIGFFKGLGLKKGGL